MRLSDALGQPQRYLSVAPLGDNVDEIVRSLLLFHKVQANKPALSLFKMIATCDYVDYRFSPFWQWRISVPGLFSQSLYKEPLLRLYHHDTVTEEMIQPCLMCFLCYLVTKNPPPEVQTYPGALYYWEYLRLCLCMKYRLPEASTSMPLSNIRALNNELKVLTEKEVDDIAIEAKMVFC